MTSGRRLPRRSVSQSYVFTPQAAPNHISLWHTGVSEGPKPGYRVVPTGKRTVERDHSRHRVRLIHFDEESDGSLVARVRPFYARARVLGIVSWQNLRRNGRAK
jgi:hypothetical protein